MAQKHKILIIGGSGYVGSTLAKALAPKHEVIVTHRKEYSPIEGVEYFKFTSLSDKDACKNLMAKFQPEIVIYTAGSNDVDAAERDSVTAQLVHSTCASVVLSAADYIKAKYIFISCDHVFTGSDGNYSESDTAIPFSQIGKAKLGAENYIRSRSNNHIIIRASLLLGRGTLNHPSWLDTLRENQIRKKKTPVSKRTYVNPVHISMLTTVIEKVIDQDIRNKTLHLGGLTKMTVYEVAQKFIQSFKYDEKLLEEANEVTTVNDFSLNFTQTLRLLKIDPLLLEQSLELLK